MEAAGIEPYLPSGRQHHNPKLEERFTEAPKNADSVVAMAHRMKNVADKKFHAHLKSTVEPFGITKEVMGGS